MQEVDYGSYVKDLLANRRALLKVMAAPRRSKKQRQQDEVTALLLLDIKRWERALVEGRIEELGRREFVFR